MNTRRAFLKTAAAAVAGGRMGWEQIAQASEGRPLLVRDAKIIRLRGYAGPLLKEQAAAFPANLREMLAGRDAADPDKLNFATLWAACHPGNAPGRGLQGVGNAVPSPRLRVRVGQER
jgi:FtsP/CotA-like multicopper oxidase with cupredoxin domain